MATKQHTEMAVLPVMTGRPLMLARVPALIRSRLVPVRGLHGSPVLSVQSTPPRWKVETMKQVDVDERLVQDKLGTMHMDFVRKAEKKNKERAKMHKFFRRTDWMIAATCFSIVIGIYGYTMYAIKQERFLDDFEMPEEIDKTEEE